MEVIQMNKKISPVAKELEEFLKTADGFAVFPYCPECGKKLENGDTGLCDGDILICDKCFMEIMLGDDPWDDMELPEDWLGHSIPSDEDLPF